MAVHDSGRQIAFEVQLSEQSEDDYIARSQRYSDAGIFVVWLVPSQPFWPRVRVPVIETGFGKSTELEGNASGLLGLQARIPGISTADAPLGCLVDDVLAERVPWHIDPPGAQLDHLRDLEEAREAEAHRRKLAAQHFTVERGRQERLEGEAFLDAARRPSQILGRGFSPTPVSRSIVRVTTVMCRNDHRCLIWQARPALPTIRVGVSGYSRDDTGEVRRAVETAATTAPSVLVTALLTMVKKSTNKDKLAFRCPRCRAVLPADLIDAIPESLWDLISQPSPHATPQEPAQRPPSRSTAKPSAPAVTPESRNGRLTEWRATGVDSKEIARRLEVIAHREQQKNAILADPRYETPAGGFRTLCLDCGSRFEDFHEGIHADGRCRR